MKKYLVKVIFNIRAEQEHPKEYDFVCFFECKPNDILVVDTRFGFQLVRVVSVAPLSDEDYESSKERLKEVVDVVDFSEFNGRKAYREEKAYIKKKMDARIARLQKDSMYDFFAEKDETLRDLLARYRDLDLF